MRVKVTLYLDGKVWDETVQARDYQDAKDICYNYLDESPLWISHTAIIFNGEDTGFCFALRPNTDNACRIHRVADADPIYANDSPKRGWDDVKKTVQQYSDGH